jgi:hypothetical protein
MSHPLCFYFADNKTDSECCIRLKNSGSVARRNSLDVDLHEVASITVRSTTKSIYCELLLPPCPQPLGGSLIRAMNKNMHLSSFQEASSVDCHGCVLAGGRETIDRDQL